MFKIALTAFGLLLSMQSMAHGGHDHSDPMASLVHLMWIAPLVIGVAFMIKQVSRRFNNTQDKEG